MANITFRYDRRVPNSGFEGLGDLAPIAKGSLTVGVGVAQIAIANWILNKTAQPWYVKGFAYLLYGSGAWNVASPLINYLSP